MGASTSSQNSKSGENVSVTDYVLQKLSVKSGPDNRENYSPESKAIEDASIKALQKMEEMDNAITKKYNLTTENFETIWKDFMKNYGHLLQALQIQSFDEEREKIAAAFSDKSFESKEEAIKAYEAAVKEELQRITDKAAKEIKEENRQKEGAASSKK